MPPRLARPTRPSPPANTFLSADSLPNQLSALEALRSRGTLSDDEFAAAKLALISGATRPPPLDPGSFATLGTPPQLANATTTTPKRPSTARSRPPPVWRTAPEQSGGANASCRSTTAQSTAGLRGASAAGPIQGGAATSLAAQRGAEFYATRGVCAPGPTQLLGPPPDALPSRPSTAAGSVLAGGGGGPYPPWWQKADGLGAISLQRKQQKLYDEVYGQYADLVNTHALHWTGAPA